MPSYVKELAMHISRLDKSWIESSFMHVLEAALLDLSLDDL